MKYRKMGRTGLMMSELSLGCMNFGNQTKEEDAVKIVQRAYELGINHFDTAKVYPIGGTGFGVSEKILGKVLKSFRHEVIITTKVEGLSRKEIMASVDESLKHLQTDYIDIYLAHNRDPKTPIDVMMMMMFNNKIIINMDLNSLKYSEGSPLVFVSH